MLSGFDLPRHPDQVPQAQQLMIRSCEIIAGVASYYDVSPQLFAKRRAN